MTEHLFSVFWFMLVFIEMDIHDQTFSQNSSVLKFFKFLMHLDNLVFENKGQECQFLNVSIWITHMVAYLCTILCLVIGIQANIQNQ
jgi:ABC-type phosphate/phosphonate transport system permease subunit